MRFHFLECARRAPRSAATTCRCDGRAGCGCSATSRSSSSMEEEQREFLATMSHEIKTPLSGIAGAAELLRDAALRPARARAGRGDRRRRAGARRAAARRARRVARRGRARASPRPPDYDPRRLLTSIAGVLRPSLRGRPLELLVEVDADVPDALHGDAARVRQIVLNLASATRSSTPSPARRGSTPRVAGERLLITVSDTGPRASPRRISQRLFEPWTRNHARAWAGTGLGPQHRAPAGARDGRRRDRRLRARRRARRSRSSCRWPRASWRRSSAGQGRPGAGREPRAGGRGRPGAAPADRHAARAPGRVEPTLVEHGQAAVEAARGGGFDAILLDLRMPVLGGIEAARAIRERDPEIPILALTADTAAEDVERCRAAGMDGHLGQAGLAARAARASSTAGSRRCSTTRCSTSSPRASAAARSSTRCSPSTAPACPSGSTHLRAATDPAALREAAHALRSPSAGFGIARLAARLRVGRDRRPRRPDGPARRRARRRRGPRPTPRSQPKAATVPPARQLIAETGTVA